MLGPQITLDSTENYSGTSAGLFTPAAGTWTPLATDTAAPTNARYTAAVTGTTPALSLYTLPKPISSSSYLELQASVRSTGLGGIVFDYYSPTDFKFVVLDVPGKRVLVGHSDPTRGWMVDSATAWTALALAGHVEDDELEVRRAVVVEDDAAEARGAHRRLELEVRGGRDRLGQRVQAQRRVWGPVTAAV